MAPRACLILFLFAFAAAAQTSTVKVGVPGDPVSIFTSPSPVFGLPNATKVVYKQLYASSDFPNPIVISSIQFFAGSGSLTPADYIISLATVPTVLGAFPVPDPPVSHVLFSGHADSTHGFTFTGVPYTYDPAAGNLLVIITGQNYGQSGFARMIGRTPTTGGTGLFSDYVTWYYANGTSGSEGSPNGFGMSTEFNGVPETGTINVTTNLAAASFSITGQAVYDGSGTSFTEANAPAGQYTIKYGAVAGYKTPPPQTQLLGVGDTIGFSATYTAISMTGTINVTTNRSAATFTILGPSVYYTGSGTSFVQTAAPVGKYSIKFGPITGYTVPLSQQKTLIVGADVTFVADYKPVAPVGTITVTSTPAHAGFQVSGPGLTYYTGNTPLTISNAPAGDYTITWDILLLGYTIPASETLTLVAGGDIAFAGTYAQSRGVIQLICVPLAQNTALYFWEPYVVRHCYFLATDWQGSQSTYGAYDIQGQLTPGQNDDLKNGQPYIPRGCTGGALGSECTVVPLLRSSFAQIVTALGHDAAGSSLGQYNITSNNCNTWAQGEIDKLHLAVTLPNDVVSNSDDVCRLYPLLLQRLGSALGVSPTGLFESDLEILLALVFGSANCL